MVAPNRAARVDEFPDQRLDEPKRIDGMAIVGEEEAATEARRQFRVDVVDRGRVERCYRTPNAA